MASFAYAQSQKAHINMGMVIRRFPRSLGLGIFSFMGLLSAATAGAVGYAAILQAQSAMERNAVTSVLQIPLYPFYYVEAIAMFIFTAVLLYDAALASWPYATRSTRRSSGLPGPEAGNGDKGRDHVQRQ